MTEFWLSIVAILIATFAFLFVGVVIGLAISIKLGWLPGVTLADFKFWKKNENRINKE